MSANKVQQVPVTIITGSLGAGKSTLMRYILHEKHGYRIAVIENEFADSMGIESLILKEDVEGKIADGFFELQNGCLCCSMKDSLVQTLQKIMEVRDKFDYILVETSGLADPGPVASIFWTDLDDDSPLMLDGIVTLIDAANFDKSLRRERGDGINEVERQIAYADVILLNKCDLVSPERLSAVRSDVLRLNPLTKLVETVQSKVPLSEILHIGRFSGALTAAALPEHEAAGCSCPVHADHGHEHDHRVSHCILEAFAPIPLSNLNLFIGSVLWEKQAVNSRGAVPLTSDIFRMKGVAWCSNSPDSATPTAYLLQSVHQLFDLTPLPDSISSTLKPNHTQIFCIGQDLADDKAALLEAFQNLVPA